MKIDMPRDLFLFSFHIGIHEQKIRLDARRNA